MKLVTLRGEHAREILRRRLGSRLYRFDEVWDGTYLLSPIADNDHQWVSGGLTTAFSLLLANRPGTIILPGANVSDRRRRWVENYRIPDVLVFFPGCRAINKQTHWLGGPDFAVEVVSHGDRARKKLDFYAKVGTRELLFIDREPWRLELHGLVDGRMTLEGVSGLDSGPPLLSDVLGLNFRLASVADIERPRIEVTRPADGLTWLA